MKWSSGMRCLGWRGELAGDSYNGRLSLCCSGFLPPRVQAYNLEMGANVCHTFWISTRRRHKEDGSVRHTLQVMRLADT